MVGEDNTNDVPFNIDNLSIAVKRKTKKDVLFCVRTHYFCKNNIRERNLLNVSNYPDMQDLLVAADLLITDYSSSIWDYALTRKPCILYCPDIDQYNSDRGFYTSPSEWAGLVCKTENELINTIDSFDKKLYRAKVDKYLEDCGNCDDGKATIRILSLIKNLQHYE
jgi:CDP-glycerol glycerophosphotransferase